MDQSWDWAYGQTPEFSVELEEEFSFGKIVRLVSFLPSLNSLSFSLHVVIPFTPSLFFLPRFSERNHHFQTRPDHSSFPLPLPLLLLLVVVLSSRRWPRGAGSLARRSAIRVEFDRVGAGISGRGVGRGVEVVEGEDVIAFPTKGGKRDASRVLGSIEVGVRLDDGRCLPADVKIRQKRISRVSSSLAGRKTQTSRVLQNKRGRREREVEQGHHDQVCCREEISTAPVELLVAVLDLLRASGGRWLNQGKRSRSFVSPWSVGEGLERKEGGRERRGD